MKDAEMRDSFHELRVAFQDFMETGDDPDDVKEGAYARLARVANTMLRDAAVWMRQG